MQSESYYRRITCELINNSGSELEILDKLRLVRDALNPDCEIHNQLSQLQPRLKRMLKKNQNGIIDIDSFEINMNKIINSANQILRRLELKDIAIEFELNEKEELVYQITNAHHEVVYKFIGKIRNQRPNGKGKAIYHNGDYYRGAFYQGNRSGIGTLYNKNNVILKEGNWKKDKFVGKGIIKFFPNVKVAANSIAFPSDIKETDYEIIEIPSIKGDGLLAFPIV